MIEPGRKYSIKKIIETCSYQKRRIYIYNFKFVAWSDPVVKFLTAYV